MARTIRYVTLDATGTLLRPRERIGATYVAHCHRVISASSSLCPPLPASRREALERAVDANFPVAFRDHAARFPNFGRAVLSTETAEPWWSRVILASLPGELLDALPLATQRHELTSTLYAYYARGDAWRVFDDVFSTLEALEARHIRMAVVSDFDERLPRLLEELGLAPFVETVTTSWEVGESKPSPAMFRHAFAAFGGSIRPCEVLHVGDHVKRDYHGPRAASAHARLLVRGHGKGQEEADGVPRSHVLTSLNEVLPLVQ
jgi:putative hydrolase of the HAD superfamily